MVRYPPGTSVRNYSTWLWRYRVYLKRSTISIVMVVYFLLVSMLTLVIYGRYPNQTSGRGFLRLGGSNTTNTVCVHSRVVLTAQSASPTETSEMWARGPSQITPVMAALRDMLGVDATQKLRSLCGRCLYRTLTSYVRVKDHGQFTVVLTGDIAAMWLRDSAVQMASYIPRVPRRPALRQTLEGAIRAQAYFILQVNT